MVNENFPSGRWREIFAGLRLQKAFLALLVNSSLTIKMLF
jgi:hypothetical protein